MSEKTFNNKKVVITRPVERSEAMARIIREYDGIPVIVPTLELQLVKSEELQYISDNIGEFDWIIFTSPAGVKSFYAVYNQEEIPVKVAVIGVKTEEEINRYGIKPDLIPAKFTAEGLLESFEKIDLKGSRIALPRTLSARKVLPEGLALLGAEVYIAEAYTSSIPENHEDIISLVDQVLLDKIDIITFTSPLTVKNLLKIVNEEKPDKYDLFLEKLQTKIIVGSIGPITGNVLREYSIQPVEPERYTVKDMVEALLQ